MKTNKNNVSMKLNVTITREIFENEDRSFLVYLAYYYNNKNELDEISINCSGFELRPGKTIVVGKMGNYRGKPSFKCEYEEFDSTSYDSKYNLLCSIDGIKGKTAKKILDAIPGNDIEIFYSNNAPKIKGIGPKTIKKIHEGLNFLRANKSLKELIGLLGQTIGNSKIHDLNKYLLEKGITVNQFKADPYTILIDIIGVQFKKVDYLAQEKFGCDKYLRSRILYLTEKVVNVITGFGHTYTNLENFNNKIQSLNLNPDNINTLIDADDSKVVNIDGNIQTKEIYIAEKTIPSILKSYKEKSLLTEYEKSNIKILIRQYEKENNIILHDMQKEAVFESIVNNVSIICGGAGTGKSTIAKCIIFVLKKLNNSVLCTSPTGKASRRLSETTDEKAYTCHRFYYAEETSKITKQPTDWQSIKPTTIIIDEFSMVDTKLFCNVLEYMLTSKTNFTRIILVGDPGQLPSVGPGCVMADIIKSNVIKVIELTNTFRQGADSNILVNANKVRINETFDQIKKKDFFVNCPKDINNYILRCFLHQYELKQDIDTFYNDFQICTSNRKKCNEINTMIQKELKNTQFQINKKSIGFGIGDKVMCTTNDYVNDIYNGEFGRVVSLKYRTNNMNQMEDDLIVDSSEGLKKLYENKTFIKNCSFQVYYSGLDKEVSYCLDYDSISDFQLSYCCTIHKLQGSEFKLVICDVSEFNMITDSRLLYTAITRAKQQFILLSNSMETVDKIVKNKLSSKRNTLLLEKLKTVFNKNEAKKIN